MKRIVAICACMVLSISTVATPVFAHGEETNVAHPHNKEEALELRKQKLEEALEKREQQLTTNKAKRCEFIKAKLQFHRDRAAQIRSHRAERYQNIIDRLDALADRLDKQGIDSAALRDAIQQLTNVVNTYAGTFTTYEAELQEAIVSACDDGEITRDEIAALRSLLVRLRRNADTVHTFVRQDLKPALEAVKESVIAARQENASSQNKESTSAGTSEMTIEGTPESETGSDIPAGN